MVTDFYLINENDVKGHFVLGRFGFINLQSVAGGVSVLKRNRQVKVIGGETYGQLIADSVCLKNSLGGRSVPEYLPDYSTVKMVRR